MKRMLSLALCLIMMFSVSTFAAGEIVNELLPLSVVEFFAEQGYDISRTAKMELVSNVPQAGAYGLNSASENRTSAYTLRITEQDGNQVTVYDTILLSKNEAGVYERDNDILEYIITRGIGTPESGGTVVINNKIALTARTSYSIGTIQTLGTVYKPMSISFSYSTYTQCTVGAIEVTYSTSGTAYSGLSSTTPTAYNYTHGISKNVSIPAAGTLYNNTLNPCPYYIDIAYGGMLVTYSAKIDGSGYEGEF